MSHTITDYLKDSIKWHWRALRIEYNTIKFDNQFNERHYFKQYNPYMIEYHHLKIDTYTEILEEIEYLS